MAGLKRFLACLLIALSGAGLNTGAAFYNEGQVERGLFDCAVAVLLFALGAGLVRHRDEA